MARNTRRPRFSFAQLGGFGRANVIHRSVVCPSETLRELKCRYRLQSLPVGQAVGGAYVDTWFFYVPFRLVFPSYVDFLMSDGGSAPVKNGAAVVHHFFEQTTTINGLLDIFEPAYDLVVSEFFRTDEDAALSTPPHWLPNPELTALAVDSVTADQYDQDIEVTPGTPDTVSLSAIEEAMALREDQQRSDAIGSDYATYLREFGVDVRNDVIQKPEFLGHRRSFVYPSRTVDPSDGQTVQSYFVDIDMTLRKPRYFMEHGFLLGIQAVRPKVVAKSMPFDLTMTQPAEWPTPWQHQRSKFADYDDATPINAGFDQDLMFWYGQPLVNGAGVPWSLTCDAVDARWPTDVWGGINADAVTLSGADFAMDGYVATRIRTPLVRDRTRLIR